jgi:hypothetical protein
VTRGRCFGDVVEGKKGNAAGAGSEYIKYEHGPVPSRAEKCIRQLREDKRLHTEKVPFAGIEMIAVSPLGPPTWSALSDGEVFASDSAPLPVLKLSHARLRGRRAEWAKKPPPAIAS